MTITLLLNSEGKKMGKTESGAVWLDPNKTSPFDFYQYWRNVADADVLKCIRMLTFLPLEQIDEMDHWEGSQLNKAKEILAYRTDCSGTRRRGSKESAGGSKSAVFGGNAENMPTATKLTEDFQDGAIDLISLLCKAELVASRSEGRRAIEQGGVSGRWRKNHRYPSYGEKRRDFGRWSCIKTRQEEIQKNNLQIVSFES